MLKIKILHPSKGRNEPTFRPLRFIAQRLLDYGIQLVDEGGDFDYLFIGMNDFIDKKLPLKESIQKGLEFLYHFDCDYFLFDGSDSTSLMGAYEVFENSHAKGLFKNQLLINREDYKTPTAHNKWWFGNDGDLLLGYDIPEEVWSKIHLTGYNLGYLNPHYHQPINFPPKTDSVCAIFQCQHDENYDHNSRNDIFYSNHRQSCWDMLSTVKYNKAMERMPHSAYLQFLAQSKVTVSPFGMGEVCFRDFEANQFYNALVKPDMSGIKTEPSIYLPDTYLPVKPDFSNLEEVITTAMTIGHDVADHAREVFLNSYNVDRLCLHWYNFFANMKGIENE